MEKPKKWQILLILAVIALTVYNVLPTLFYYFKPLKESVTETQGAQIASSIQQRVNALETESIDWTASFCDLLHVHPTSIRIDPQNPQWLSVSFAKGDDATRFRSFLPRAGSLVPFLPAQLGLASQEQEGKEVRVQRKIPIRLDGKENFSFASKGSEQYRKVVVDRAVQIARTLAGTTDAARALQSVERGNLAPLEALAHYICLVGDILEQDSTLGARYAAGLTQSAGVDRPAAVKTLIHAFDQARDALKQTKMKEGAETSLIERKEIQFAKAENLLKKWETLFAAGQDPWDDVSLLEEKWAKGRASLSIGDRNPLFSEIAIDQEKNRLLLKLHPGTFANEQLLIDEVAKVSQRCNETIKNEEGIFVIDLHHLSDVSGLLVWDLNQVAQTRLDQLIFSLQNEWHPTHPDLQNFLIVTPAQYASLPLEQRALCCIVADPLLDPSPTAFQNPYVVARGIERLQANYATFPDSEPARTFFADWQNLMRLFRQNGFFVHPSFQEIPFSGDVLFERSDEVENLIAATREDFQVQGTKKYAVLELSNQEQRLLTENKIDTQIHEDLIKWRDEYRTAQVSLEQQARWDVPKPTHSVFWSNIALSAAKFFRGDERKIIRWGLDLSGGKTVQIELRDVNNVPVHLDADIKQAINELYQRVNKIGVSEVSIRQVGSHVVLDFPGSQAFSAAELIKASTLYFHVVNEKFSTLNPSLGETVNRFLQEVWNEAVVSGKKDPLNLQKIASKHLGQAEGEARSEASRVLWEQGLRLQAPEGSEISSAALDDRLSKVAILQGTSPTEWHGQTHPLILVFSHFALEGSHLENIRSSYDPSKGNYLSFDIARKEAQDNLHAWTSRFSKESVAGTPNEAFTRGRGWRMAALLNDSVVSTPTLNDALRSSAMISGSFSQREVSKLAADLKAGSLTFTPHILSETNVSPELGKTDRYQGITATVVALILVIGAMVFYYRFAGWIASVAVLFNLLILWATLQNLGATLTLAGIAGVILTVGMAVDANVLVFERIKEEFSFSKRIGSSIHAGYKKAYSAIVDSNVTTIIAALILLNFDAGPIKSFAVNLIIGIASSMFTALFMTRVYFTRWLQNPQHQSLNMSNWIHGTNFPFLKHAKKAFGVAALIIIGGGYLIFAQGASIFGMDFTGGYSLNLEVESSGSKSYVTTVAKALQQSGLDERDFQIRELSPANHLRLLLSTTLEQREKPFFGMPLETATGENPRIAWVANALRQSGVSISADTLAHLDANWSSMSGQMSDSMRFAAIIGLLLSFASIFVYLSFRFEYKFAAAALICLLHDVLITLGMMGLLYTLGVPVQIDLNTVAALMTIVGYSLNDTIIIFDRIREEMRLQRGKKLDTIVNAALNATLSRTTITSGTTLLVLIALVALGGSSIFSFALVMTIGVFFGTLSSWFIASPLMLFFHRREENQAAVSWQN